MTRPPEVAGRPAWARDEPITIQRVIVEYRLTQSGLRALREFATDPGRSRWLPHSVARSLRDRGFGEITAKQSAGRLTPAHPKADFVLSVTGLEVLARVVVR